ncbi:putative PEP-binding protein [Cronbergia sp. UHCC 0137]|uniref:putative PEP-binding protein n=1 Tax=Cronbergia sp. UHCC 0137 TaxID=3110239 RepID=UPI002B1F5DF2|nr:putative PEP-binding protein [Cronbergia sp. UHCC 0137]MEA5616745.1 putative PEP-binding protein [Cronbergia sp. UHCC 0137]
MDKLYWLEHIKIQDRPKVGDKAFYLSRIIQRGYPVVPGFVVSAEVLRQFLEALHSSESLVADLPHSSLHLDVANWRQLQQVARQLRQEIISASVPQHWVNTIFKAARKWQSNCLILRPTLTVPTATQGMGNVSGLMEAVFCTCDEQAIAQGLKLLWSQLFRARSLLYWHSIDINLQQINLAVLVQPVENAIASGVFNANTLGWEIEATWGLEVAMSKGEVLPDVYYIQQETGVVIERQLGNKILAYGVNNTTTIESEQVAPASVLTTDHDCLLAYLLKEQQQKEYALPEEYLQQVITLGNRLVSELGTKLTMKWTISQETPDPKLYITQISSPQAVIPNLHLIKGIGAARGRVIGNAHVINSQQKPEKIPQGVILIAPSVTPDWLPVLQEVGGIVTEQGGLTSHAAILARELAIPSVVNATDATNLFLTGERLLIDGDRGEIYRFTENKEQGTENPVTPASITSHPSPVISYSLPVIATQLLVNLSQSSLVEQVQNLPVDGVGLLRSELMVLKILKGQHPQSWVANEKQTELLQLWVEEILRFARAFSPRPILYRSLDWRSPDLPSLNHGTPQSVLGERGTLSYLRNPAVFELELKALAAVQQAGYSNIHLMLPFVRRVEEFVFCRRKVEEAGLTQLSQFQLWIMAEVPSVLFLLPEYIKAGVAGISIGTNDLTQLLLGVDREQGQLGTIFDERHPAVMGAIAQLITMAKDGGIPCSICGQAPVLYPEIIDQLVQWGITSISVEPEAVERTYRAIARAEQRLILAAARHQLKP